MKNNKYILVLFCLFIIWINLVIFLKKNIMPKTSNSEQVIPTTIKQNTVREYFFSYIDNSFLMNSQEKSCFPFRCYSSIDFIKLYSLFEKSTLLPITQERIHEDKKIHDHIENIAKNMGYKKRINADEKKLHKIKNIQIQYKILSDYTKLKKEIKKENILISITSGYRSPKKQKQLFFEKIKKQAIPIDQIITGKYDHLLKAILEKTAPPGYSKHHSGFTLDLACGENYIVYDFEFTQCHEWLSKNNFENAKRFGFLPSYPNGVIDQGPNPEPWEYVWVGEEFIKKQKL